GADVGNLKAKVVILVFQEERDQIEVIGFALRIELGGRAKSVVSLLRLPALLVSLRQKVVNFGLAIAGGKRLFSGADGRRVVPAPDQHQRQVVSHLIGIRESLSSQLKTTRGGLVLFQSGEHDPGLELNVCVRIR